MTTGVLPLVLCLLLLFKDPLPSSESSSSMFIDLLSLSLPFIALSNHHIDLRSHRDYLPDEHTSLFKEQFPKRRLHCLELAGMQYKAINFLAGTFSTKRTSSLRAFSLQPERPDRSLKRSETHKDTKILTLHQATDDHPENSLLDRYTNYLLHCQAQICQVRL